MQIHADRLKLMGAFAKTLQNAVSNKSAGLVAEKRSSGEC